MPTEASDERSRVLEQANALLSSSSKWLIAALGAIGAVLVAGSQLSSLGSLPLGPRFTAALVGLALGLVGVIWAIWRVLDVLAPRRYTISELSAEWVRSGAVADEGVRGWWKRYRHPVPDWFARNSEHLAGQDSPKELLKHWKKSEEKRRPDRQAALEAINNMVALATYTRARVAFARMKPALALAMLMAAAGISVFAWAANPPEKSPATLRNADLSGTDLTGVSLAGADLTGTNLTGANLKGAVMKDAILKDVTWSNTTCPDGTNSDDTASASGKDGSCEGHLVP